MPTIAQAQRPPANIDQLVRIDSAAKVPPPTTNQESTTGMSTWSIGPAPDVLTSVYDRIRQWNRPGVSQFRTLPLPLKANPQIGAIAASVQTPSSAAASSAGLTFRGTWKNFFNYKINDVVISNLSTYVAIQGSVGKRPDLFPLNWTLLSENLYFDADVVVRGNAGFGTLDKNSRNQGSNVFPATSPPTSSAAPSESTGWAVLLSSVNDLPSGWVDLGASIGLGSVAGLYTKSFSTSATISTSQAALVRWCTNLSLFQGAGESITGTVTSVQVASNVVTILCANTWVAGTRVKFAGLSGGNFLNGQTITITSRTPTSITGTFVHANYGPTTDSGTATYIPYLQAVSVSLTSGTHATTATFANPTTSGSTILLVFGANDVNNTGTINSIADGTSSYTIYAENNSGAGSFAHIALAQGVASGSPTYSINYTVNNASAAGMFLIELPGSGSNDTVLYEPYDVKEFRGSMFVCNTETTQDAFADPNSWWMIAQGTGYVDILSGAYGPTILDYGRLLSNTAASSYTVTLPTTPPSNSWWIALQNSNSAGSIVIDPNGRTIDGASGTMTLRFNQGVILFTDGTNYFTERGLSPLGTQWNVTAQNTTYAAAAGDYVLCTTTSAGFTVTLPAASANVGRGIRIKKVSSDANILTIGRTGSDTIDGATAQTITIQYNEMEFVSDGTNWWIS